MRGFIALMITVLLILLGIGVAVGMEDGVVAGVSHFAYAIAILVFAVWANVKLAYHLAMR